MLITLGWRFLRCRVSLRPSDFDEVRDTQARRVHPVAISLPCNPEGKDEDGKRDGDRREEPPLSTNDDRFATVVVSFGVEEYHAEQGLRSRFIR